MSITNRNYLLNVWLTTLVSAPTIMMVTSNIVTFKDSSFAFGDFFGFIFLAIIYGLMLSIPTILFCFALFPRLLQKLKKQIEVKTGVILIALIGMTVTFFIFFGRDAYNLNGNYAGITFSLSYGICTVISGLIYNIE